LTAVDTELLWRKCAYLWGRKFTIATRIWWRGCFLHMPAPPIPHIINAIYYSLRQWLAWIVSA
jgi:hypothetical protein